MAALSKSPRVQVLLEIAGTDDATEYTIQTDNRDMVRFDRARAAKKWPTMQDAPLLWMTFIAWAALKRADEFAGDYDEFEGMCLQVLAVDADGNPVKPPTAGGAAETVDPTK